VAALVVVVSAHKIFLANLAISLVALLVVAVDVVNNVHVVDPTFAM
jgi:hypothetical protein